MKSIHLADGERCSVVGEVDVRIATVTADGA
jgi:hypothetical protein